MNRERVITAPSLRPSRYDRVASLVISMLILTGTSVAVLVVLWLATPREMARVIPPFGDGGQGRDKATAEPDDLDTPSPAELSRVAVTEPTIELSELITPESVIAAIKIDIEGPRNDSRPIGPPLPPEAVPRWERWEIRYEASNLRAYARQLDFFGIELGAVGRKQLVDYASHFTKGSPMTRSGSGSDEQRLYMTWRGGRLQAMDRELLKQAGIDVAGRTLLQFYPQNVEDTLARVELEHTKDGRVDKLRKTIFGVRHTDDRYEFFIIEQR
ncbi:MAG: hypothetical protein O3C40_04900 [Planctomycetota bacterium]|nr:hypothetical protein [Planctomycetota bacterium]